MVEGDETREYGLVASIDCLPAGKLVHQFTGRSQRYDLTIIDGQGPIIQNGAGLIHDHNETTVDQDVNRRWFLFTSHH